MAVQLQNDEMIELLRSVFQARYEPNFAWKSAASALLSLPGVRGAWTMGVQDGDGDAQDLTTNVLQLSDIDDPEYGYDGLASYVEFDGTNYLAEADTADLDITGLETFVKDDYKGLTMGCWVYPQAVDTLQAVIGKWNDAAVNERSYLIDLTAGNVFRAQISTAGTAATIDTVSSTVTVTANAWYYVSMTFDPSTRLAINVNGTITENLVGIGASIHSGAADFVVGADDNGANDELTGRVSLSWLCAMYHADYLTEVLREQTRAMYGV